MVLKLFKSLTPDQFSKTAYSEIVSNLDLSQWTPSDLISFCVDQIEHFAEEGRTDKILLWSVFLSYAKERNAKAYMNIDNENDTLFAIVFEEKATNEDGTESTTNSALIFDQELVSVTPPDQSEVDTITDLLKKALGG